MNSSEFYHDLYKTATMGYEAVAMILPKTDDMKLQNAATDQMEGYKRFAGIARERLAKIGEKPQEENFAKKVPARLGIMMNTLFDTSSGHIAEMLINGSNMGIIDLSRSYNRLTESKENSEAVSLCREVIGFEENNISEMKKYL